MYILLPSDVKVGPSNIAMSIARILSCHIDIVTLSLYSDLTLHKSKRYDVTSFSNRKFDIFGQIRSCLSFFSKGNEDIVINTHGIRPLLFASLVRLLNKKIRIIHSQHVYDQDDLFKRHNWFKSTAQQRLRSLIYKIPDHIVVATDELNSLYNKDSIECVTINNFTRFNNESLNRRLNKHFNINFMSNLITLKRPLMLVNCLINLKLDDVKVNIFGDGELFNSVSGKLSSSGIGHKMYGNISNASEKYFCVGDIFVHTSSHEGMSIAILEAISKGNILVLADIPGNQVFKNIYPKGVYFFKTESELKNILRNLYSLERSELESIGRKMFFNGSLLFSEEKITNEWLRLIKSA